MFSLINFVHMPHEGWMRMAHCLPKNELNCKPNPSSLPDFCKWLLSIASLDDFSQWPFKFRWLLYSNIVISNMYVHFHHHFFIAPLQFCQYHAHLHFFCGIEMFVDLRILNKTYSGEKWEKWEPTSHILRFQSGDNKTPNKWSPLS